VCSSDLLGVAAGPDSMAARTSVSGLACVVSLLSGTLISER